MEHRHDCKPTPEVIIADGLWQCPECGDFWERRLPDSYFGGWHRLIQPADILAAQRRARSHESA